MSNTSILYIVATPIGNLEDITLRALRILKEVDLIVCEDTRQTLKLLNHYNIAKPLVSYFQHSKLVKIDYIFAQLTQGKNIALVTDAGTPGISDPGGKLIDRLFSLSADHSVNLLVKQLGNEKPARGNTQSSPVKLKRRDELKVVPVPGPNAAIAALSVSGLPADKFIFMGFPPHKKGRQKFFEEIVKAKYTVVFYESTHRILKTLNQLAALLSATQNSLKQSRDQEPAPAKIAGRSLSGSNNRRQIVVCRELTKRFESIYRGSPEEIVKILTSDNYNLKGEFVIVL